MVIFAILFFLGFLIFGMSRQIYLAIKAGSRIDEAADTVHKLEEENRFLQKRLGEVNQDDFIEQEARDKLNMARPGETVVVIPPSEIDKIVKFYKQEKPVEVPNWQKWLKLLWG